MEKSNSFMFVFFTMLIIVLSSFLETWYYDYGIYTFISIFIILTLILYIVNEKYGIFN